MTVGIIILCMLILFIFFGMAERFFRKLGIPNWLAFLLVLSLVVGAIIPNISFGNAFTVNVSGCIIPIVIMLIFYILMGWGSELFRSILALITVAALTVTVRLIIPENSPTMLLTSALIIGFLSGAAAFLVGQTRMAVVAATMGGIVAGDILIGMINLYFFNAKQISLGTGGVFNSLIIAFLIGLILLEAINAMMRATSRKRIQASTLSFEAAEDISKKSLNTKKREGSSLKRSNKSKGNELSKEEQIIEEFGNYDNYFDDKLL